MRVTVCDICGEDSASAREEFVGVGINDEQVYIADCDHTESTIDLCAACARQLAARLTAHYEQEAKP